MKIQKLPDEVIKKICAGEVVTRPYNALKELLENSIDAHSTSITINISSNVLNITIEDDGCGIQKKDFELLCAPHCTSKISSEDNLLKISSYGFRGEALSSISQVSKITVKSKVKDEEFGYEGTFSNGKLVDMKPIPLRDGTVVIVKDIFYNNKIRELKYFKKINELNSMIDLAFFYAVNNIGIKFILTVTGKEKFLSKKIEPNTCRCNEKTADYDDSFYTELINLRQSLATELVNKPFHSDSCIEQKIDLISSYHKVDGKLLFFDSKYATIIFSKPSANFKKNISIIFINGRLVENTSIRDYLSKMYLDILPKHRFPLIYLELRIPSGNIDVNIHPSKKEVLFNHEDVITEILGKVIEIQLKEYFSGEKENFVLQEYIKRYKPSPIKQESEETKVYCDPNSSTIFETPYVESKANKSYSFEYLQDIRNNYIEIDKDFIRSLTFLGSYDEKEVYVQHSQYLLSCDLQQFLRGSIKEFLVFNFGNFTKQNVDIVFEHNFSSEECEMLMQYFGIKILDNKIIEIPLVFGQYNDSRKDWSRFCLHHGNEKEVFEQITTILTEIYLRSFNLNSSSFNLIKRFIKGTKDILESFRILSQLKDIYKKFGR